jgi:NosR/NirI family nitrous oxide reductase transcriptional regulator
MKAAAAALLVVTAGMIIAGQSAVDPRLVAQLQRLFPSATSFSPKEGDPPHFNAYVNEAQSGARKIAGFAFWTTDLEPLERGYDGPIKILVGLDALGILTGIIVVDHHEPYGSFSIDPPEFAAQFKGKNIRDPFRVGEDIDAVSRASISILSATRAVRNSARRVARQLLTPTSPVK